MALTHGLGRDISDPGVRTIGALEVLGALGLPLPALTGMATVLFVAAVGLALVMVGAAATHRRRGELPMIRDQRRPAGPGRGRRLGQVRDPTASSPTGPHLRGVADGLGLELRPAARPASALVTWSGWSRVLR